LADYGSEKLLKKFVGRKGVEDAVLRLDMLTKEESLMVMARNLEATHQIDGVVHDVDDNVKATKVLVENNVEGIEGFARSIDYGTQQFLSVFLCTYQLFCIST
jgi:hypothetical protein